MKETKATPLLERMKATGGGGAHQPRQGGLFAEILPDGRLSMASDACRIMQCNASLFLRGWTGGQH